MRVSIGGDLVESDYVKRIDNINIDCMFNTIWDLASYTLEKVLAKENRVGFENEIQQVLNVGIVLSERIKHYQSIEDSPKLFKEYSLIYGEDKLEYRLGLAKENAELKKEELTEIIKTKVLEFVPSINNQYMDSQIGRITNFVHEHNSGVIPLETYGVDISFNKPYLNEDLLCEEYDETLIQLSESEKRKRNKNTMISNTKVISEDIKNKFPINYSLVGNDLINKNIAKL